MYHTYIGKYYMWEGPILTWSIFTDHGEERGKEGWVRG